MMQCVAVACGVPNVRVQPVAATEPTVIVPWKSEESAVMLGVVPHDESTGAVLLAEKCPNWSKENSGPVEVADHSSSRSYPDVVEAVLTFKIFEPYWSFTLKALGVVVAIVKAPVRFRMFDVVGAHVRPVLPARAEPLDQYPIWFATGIVEVEMPPHAIVPEVVNVPPVTGHVVATEVTVAADVLHVPEPVIAPVPFPVRQPVRVAAPVPPFATGSFP